MNAFFLPLLRCYKLYSRDCHIFLADYRKIFCHSSSFPKNYCWQSPQRPTLSSKDFLIITHDSYYQCLINFPFRCPNNKKDANRFRGPIIKCAYTDATWIMHARKKIIFLPGFKCHSKRLKHQKIVFLHRIHPQCKLVGIININDKNNMLSVQFNL